ncbi:uncharacterized protein apold1b [Chanos chanos]|uniref:Uncharacterized protein apold1b n=1 Tax=Chanos chanos TaxID=29144 RepID=A0A6J2VVS5_CHACN|nr:uncharacterized protein LOC115816462 [Chanos chanos]
MNMFRKERPPVVPPRPSQERSGMMGMMQKVNPFKSSSQSSAVPGKTVVTEGNTAEGGSNTTQIRREEDQLDLTEDQTTEKNPGMFKGVIQKVNPFKSSPQARKEEDLLDLAEDQTMEKRLLTGSNSSLTEHREEGNETDDKQNPGMFRGMIQKVNPFRSSAQGRNEGESLPDCAEPSAVRASENKQNPGVLKGMIQKVNPFKSTAQDTQSLQSDHSGSSGSLVENNNVVKKGITEMQPGGQEGSELSPGKKKKNTFRIKKILPGPFFGSGSKESYEQGMTSSNQDTEAQQASTQEEVVEIHTVEMAEVPVLEEGNPLDSEDDEDGLLAWWRTVEGWDEWNESTNYDEDQAEQAVEEAADRVFMAARLFVHLFNQRGASLQQRILELLALADAADNFHKKTVTASVGGGVASVAGSVTTITGLVLAPFTFGTSLIVTAVGIGVATAGGVASASANITDTVHSNTDRKKVEKMIQDYQEEAKDIKECLEFLQAGMETLEEWNFEKYAESISKKAMNQNVKHVMKEGGRAGKALLINTESLISTVQVLSVAGGAAKAAQVMSVTTGVMSGLFLALDVFFLAKDSLELRKGAKTDFAAKIREVCKELQDGLLELNRIKEELQKTMDGIEVEIDEEEEEEEEDEDEEDDEEEEEYESDPKKLAQLEE